MPFYTLLLVIHSIVIAVVFKACCGGGRWGHFSHTEEPGLIPSCLKPTMVVSLIRKTKTEHHTPKINTEAVWCNSILRRKQKSTYTTIAGARKKSQESARPSLKRPSPLEAEQRISVVICKNTQSRWMRWRRKLPTRNKNGDKGEVARKPFLSYSQYYYNVLLMYTVEHSRNEKRDLHGTKSINTSMVM